MRHITSNLLDVKPIPDTVNELNERKQTTWEGKTTMSFHSCAVGSLTSFPTVYFKPPEFLHADQVRICGAETSEKLP